VKSRWNLVGAETEAPPTTNRLLQLVFFGSPHFLRNLYMVSCVSWQSCSGCNSTFVGTVLLPCFRNWSRAHTSLATPPTVSSSSAALLSLTEVRNYSFSFCRADRGEVMRSGTLGSCDADVQACSRHETHAKASNEVLQE
jgi:hypothetical protein